MVCSFREMFSFYQQSAPLNENINTNKQLDKEAIHLNTIYLDSAATTHRLSSVIDAMQAYYQSYNANVHRGAYPLAQKATSEYEKARTQLGRFINAKRSEEIVFTSGATAALNIVANGLVMSELSGNKIVVCISEHHANLLPWQNLAHRFKLQLHAVYLDENACFGKDEEQKTLTAIDDDTAIVAFAHVSNVLGNVYPIKSICAKARSVQAISVIDGTQAAAHLRIDVQDIDCDFYALSGHKMYAGTGIGVLYGKYARLERLNASILGGEMITHVSLQSHTLQAPPLKFEAGTPNIAGAIGLAAAAKFCTEHFDTIHAHENHLYQRLYKGLAAIKGIRIWGNENESISLISISCSGIHAHDLSSALANHGVSVRAGQHCAMPLLQSLNIDASLRVSIACYNTAQEVDEFLSRLAQAIAQMSASASALSDIQNNNTLSDLTALQQNTHGNIEVNAKSLCQNTHKLETELIKASTWNEKHRLLLLNSKKIPLLAAEDRTNETSLSGCEAQVWIAKRDIIRGYSDSKVVRGLLSVLLNKANELLQNNAELKSKENANTLIMTFDYHEYLKDLGLSHYFSQGRKDGITAVITRLVSLV